MGMNKVPIDKSMTREKAISQGGYYNTDGDWNCIITLDEYPGKVLRGRVETLILKDGKVFMLLKDNGEYRIPGGGFDKGVLNIDQAFMETKEEAKMIIENIRYTGITYVRLYDEVWVHDERDIPYDGTYTEVYIANYKEDYHGYIRKGLSDMELTNKGKFYDISEVENILKPPHKQALMNILNKTVTESVIENDMILAAQHWQDMIQHLHKYNSPEFDCIWIRDIELDNEGYVFAEYNTNNKSEEDAVRKFINWCNDNNSINYINKYVEEPISYKGHGFLSIKLEYNDIL